MRDCWYGDKRDIVKWVMLVHLAREQAIKTILWVVFYREKYPQEELKLDKQWKPIPKEVWKHFRDIRTIKRLQTPTKMRIDVFNKPWGDDREAYINSVLKKISKDRRQPMIVFLDPDTGISRVDSANKKHVSDEDVEKIYRTLRTGDTLVLYQHAQRYKDWPKRTRDLFAGAIGIHWKKVLTVQWEIASDVAFFVATKNTK